MSATGTPTPNIGLRRPQGTDPASVDDINYNSALLDTKLGAVGSTSLQDQINTLSTNTAQNLGKVQDGLAIVANGNTHVAIPADYFVYVKGHNSLSEGLYKNTSGSTIAANATLSTSNLTADDDGGLNSVYDALNSKIETNETILTGSTYLYKSNKTVQLELVGCNIASLISSGIPSGYRPKHSSRGAIVVRDTYASSPRIAFLNVDEYGSVIVYAVESYNSGNVSSVSQGTADGCMTWITE